MQNRFAITLVVSRFLLEQKFDNNFAIITLIFIGNHFKVFLYQILLGIVFQTEELISKGLIRGIYFFRILFYNFFVFKSHFLF